jgi:hypothetical protein
MNTENVKKPNIIFVMVAAAVLLATAGFSTTRVLAYESSQAGSLANTCGNGEEPFNILCQNLLSQIEGDGNAVNIIGLQTGGERTTPPTEPPTEPPDTCEECFTSVLTAAEQTEFLTKLSQAFPSPFPTPPTLEDLCDVSDGDGIFVSSDIDLTEQLLGPGVGAVEGLDLEEDRIAEIVECLHRVLGF